MLITVLELIIWILRFFFGACIFSFLGVVIYRLPLGESLVKGRSHCPSCNHSLGALELIPGISYLALGGKCKVCKAKIPFRDFVCEVFGGFAFIFCGSRFGVGSLGILSLRSLLIFIYLGILLVVALIDWDTQIIYDRFHIMILILAVGDFFLNSSHGLIDRLIGALIISVPMLLLALIIPGAFGGGDIKLMFASGLFLGTGSIVCAMFLGLLTGGAYGAWMLIRKKLDRKDVFAFGPFLSLGLMIAALYGDELVGWYLHFL